MVSEERRKYHKEWKQKNPDKVKLLVIKYRKDNLLKIRERNKLWAREHYQPRIRLIESTEQKRARKKKYYSLYKDESYFGGLRILALDRDNYECQMCGMNNEQHIVIYGCSILVHHIDFNKENNILENLKVLCRSCHCRIHQLERGKYE